MIETLMIIFSLIAAISGIVSIIICNMQSRFQKERLQSLEKQLNQSQQNNQDSLDKMRILVGEKLEATLETRLNKSYEMISQTLQNVYKSVGEMNSLASGVNDLKKVLSNIKTRGMWGEVQLNALLEQVLTYSQYDTNVQLDPRSSERIEFAIKLPGKEDRPVYLPMDSKFPLESFERLIDASEIGDKEEVDKQTKLLESAIKEQAKKISSKYIIPPYTTDFAILYLPLESLYSEVVKRSGLCESLQREYRIVVCGPTTLSALLNSLQLGFKTMAIEKRGTELWKLLSVFKVQFSRFTEVLEKSQKKVDEASRTLEEATKRTRTIAQKLISVEEISVDDAENIMMSIEE